MLNKKNGLIKKIPSAKFKMLNQFSLNHIKSKNLRVATEILIVLIIVLLFGIALRKMYIEKSNDEINFVVASYFDTLNKKDFSALTSYYFPEHMQENDLLVLNIKIKSEAIQMESLQLEKIYPSLVDGNLALVGTETKQVSNYNNHKNEITQFRIDMLMKKGGKWYFARPEQVLEYYDDKYIKDMFDQYKPVLERNIPGNPNLKEFNENSFYKFVELKNKIDIEKEKEKEQKKREIINQLPESIQEPIKNSLK